MNTKSKTIRIIISATLFLLTLGFLVYQSLLNQANSLSSSNEVLATLTADIPFLRPFYRLSDNPAVAFRKIFGHFALFLSLGGFACWFCREKFSSKLLEFIVVCSIGVFFGVLTEILQFIPEGRNPLFEDILINLYGFFSAVSIFNIVTVIILHRKKIYESKDIKSEILLLAIICVLIILSIIFPVTASGTVFCYLFFIFTGITNVITVLIAHFIAENSRR